MDIKTGTFYKMKETVTANGRTEKTPGGYMYVYRTFSGLVSAIPTERRDIADTKGRGGFTVAQADFEKMIEI